MTCPICGGKTSVTNSAMDCESVYRTRKCVECGHKFTTAEIESDDKDTLLELRNQQKVGREERERREIERKFNKLVTILKLIADWAGFEFLESVKMRHKKTRKEFDAKK